MESFASDTYVVDGNITIFFGAHSESFKKDILHSSLLGQLVADISPNTWLSSYITTLGKFYWALSKAKVSNYPKRPSSLLNIASTALPEIIQKDRLQQLSNALSAITQLPSDSPASEALMSRIQRQNAPAHDEAPTFTVSTLLTLVCEDKKIISLQISFETHRAVGISVLKHPLSEKIILGDIETVVWATYLSEDKYTKIRDQVIGKLGSKPQTCLFHIL
ncbi:hypothetical protein [Pseudomonas sp. PD9R]|uniref:hypothetical protein n=1 Tax=Pseudomonas sp. PD9R TaxID=2853534 RepID=UPI001C48D718|nr:hypothetical protein [Pseudomonas sp. PD9R]MBV6826107.1 hypothetical protein [Pseudomonas sp. PD9R]